jgi:hypothetical protein
MFAARRAPFLTLQREHIAGKERIGHVAISHVLAQGSLRSSTGSAVIIISFSYFWEAPPACFAIKSGS